jgi:signal transduction histidine kinase
VAAATRHGPCSGIDRGTGRAAPLSLAKSIGTWLRLRPARVLHPQTFAERLGLANSVLVVLICVSQSWVLGHYYLDHIRGQITERGRGMGEYLAREAGRSMMSGSVGALHELVEQAGASGDVAYIRFFDAQGFLLVSGGSTPVSADAPLTLSGQRVRGPVSVGRNLWEFQAPIFATDIAQHGGSERVDSHRLGTVTIGVSLQSLEALRTRTFGTAVLFTSLFTLCAVLAVVRLARAITRPLGALASAADTVSRGDFAVRVEVDRSDEIGRLARSFNTMVDNLARGATLEGKVRELQEVTRLKSEFLATISHELRTPLNVIIGYAEMLASGAGGEVTAEQAEMLDAVRRYSKLQLDLITNVLDFSRLVSGKMSFHVERFPLEPLLAEIQALQRGRVRNRSVQLAVALDPDVPQLETDRVKLHEIVRNLVDNALKFTESGSVSVKARPARAGEWVLIEVVDTGPGIRPEDLHRIFDAFQQIGHATTRHTGGVGLGLSIVKQLVDALGGTVSVTSRLGEGSKFRVEIPRVLPKRPDSGDETAAALAALEEVKGTGAALPDQVASARPLRRRTLRAAAAAEGD